MKPTYEQVLESAERGIKHNLTKEYFRDFVNIISSLPAVSAVLTPEALAAAATAIEQEQSSGGKRSVIAPSWGAYPLVAKIASQRRAAAVLEDALPRVERAVSNTNRKRDYRQALRNLVNPSPEVWMPALVEISVLAVVERNGYDFEPYVQVGGKNHDLVLRTPRRPVHLDCLCITRSMVDQDRRVAAEAGVTISLDSDVNLVLGKIRDKAPQLREARSDPRGVIIAYSGFGPDSTTTTWGVLEAINGRGDFEAFSVFGVANGTAATGVMWFPNPRAEVPLADAEWSELTKVLPGVPVRDSGRFCFAMPKDLVKARTTLDDLDFRFLQSVA